MQTISDFRPTRETLFWTCSNICDLNSSNKKKTRNQFSESFTLTNISVSLDANISLSSDKKQLLISIQSWIRNISSEDFKFTSSSASCWIRLQNGDLVPKKSSISYDSFEKVLTKQYNSSAAVTKNQIYFQISEFSTFADDNSIDIEDLRLLDLNFELEYNFNFKKLFPAKGRELEAGGFTPSGPMSRTLVFLVKST